jgi:8-oxo-dGTP diphosphatase
MAARDILAAGGIVWRTVEGERCVGIIHRPRYGGDVSLPKGKLELGETLRECAVREVAEELGAHVELGALIGVTTYLKGVADKYVFFWEMHWVANCDDGPDGTEVVGRQWMRGAEAVAALSYETEREILAQVLSRTP